MATRTHCAHRYFVPSAKYFTVCITYRPPLVGSKIEQLQTQSSNVCYITAACCGEIINIVQTQRVFDVESLHTATCFGNRQAVRDFFLIRGLNVQL